MSRQRKTFDWRAIHAALEQRLCGIGSTYENDESRRQALLRERSASLSRAPADGHDAVALNRVLVFSSNGERYGLPLESAQEIGLLSRIAALPGSVPAVLGIVNWRGEFVVVYDLGRASDSASVDAGVPRYAIMLRAGEPRVALAAGAVEGITQLDLSKLQAADRLGGSAHKPFQGMTEDAVLVLEQALLQRRLTEDLQAA